MAIVQDITIPTDPPSSTDRPNFRQRADAFVAWMKVFATQIASLIPQLNTVLASIESMYLSVINAYNAVIAAANFQGTWTNQTTQKGQSWLYNGVVYMVLIAGNTSPTTSPSNWLAIGVRTVNGTAPDSSGNITIEDRLGTAKASAATTTIGTIGSGDYFHITGTTPISSFGAAAIAGIRRTLGFDAALTITNGSNLICPGAVNITTIAGMVIEVVAETTTIWRVVSITHPNISMAELGYLDGLTSNIQTQFNSKQMIVQGTVVNTTTGTAIDFTGIPSWAKKISVMFNSVGTNGSSNLILRIGSSTVDVTSTYVGVGGYTGNTNNCAGYIDTTGFQVTGVNSSSFTFSGILTLLNLSSYVYCLNGNLACPISYAYNHLSAGTKTLSGPLDRIRITTINGTDIFNAGQINIMYEG